MGRFFVSAEAVSGGEIRITNPSDVHHLTRARRVARGESVEVSDGERWEYRAEVSRVERDAVWLRITDKQSFAREPALRLTLFQGLPKGAKLEEVIRKSVEIGVCAIVPVFCARTTPGEAGDARDADRKTRRRQSVADEAAKQCGRGLIPEVRPALRFAEALNALSEYDTVIFAYENETKRTIKHALRGLTRRPGTVALVIGPEGGFADEEAAALRRAGAVSVSLGRTVLRTETAGPVAAAMILYELEL